MLFARADWLASSEVISQVLFTSEQPRKNKMAFVGILSQLKLLFGPLVIQLVWYILKQLFPSTSVNNCSIIAKISNSHTVYNNFQIAKTTCVVFS